MTEQKELENLVSELRDVFQFPPEKDYDKGYDMNNKDGWHIAELTNSPLDCLEAIVRIAKQQNYTMLRDWFHFMPPENKHEDDRGLAKCPACGDTVVYGDGCLKCNANFIFK